MPRYNIYETAAEERRGLMPRDEGTNWLFRSRVVHVTVLFVCLLFANFLAGTIYNLSKGLPPSDKKKILANDRFEGEDASNLDEKVITIRHDAPRFSNASVCDILNEKFPNGTQNAKVAYWFHKNWCDDLTLGNNLARVYFAKVLSAAAGASFQYGCQEREEDNSVTFTKLLKDHYRLPSPQTDLRDAALPTLSEICDNCNAAYANVCNSPGLDLAADSIRADFRAIAPKIQIQDDPSEVAIHIRCGDALTTRKKSYGLLPFSTFRNIIETEGSAIKSIGIVTQPFERNSTRERDQPSVKRCRIVVQDLVSYLETSFPETSVKVYNDPQTESISTAYARLVKASKITICGASTFCVYATMASRGTGYIIKSTLFPWVEQVSNRFADVKQFEAPLLTGRQIQNMNDTQILAWLRSEPAI